MFTRIKHLGLAYKTAAPRPQIRRLYNATVYEIHEIHKTTVKKSPTDTDPSHKETQTQGESETEVLITNTDKSPHPYQSEHIKSGVDGDIFQIKNVSFTSEQSGPEDAVVQGDRTCSSGNNPLQWSSANRELSYGVDEVSPRRFAPMKEKSHMSKLKKKEKGKSIDYVDVSPRSPV